MNTFVTPWIIAHQAPLFMEFSSENTGLGCHSLPQVIFLTQESNPGILQCRQIHYHSEPQGKLILGFRECLRAGDVWPKLTTEQELSGEIKRKGL